MNQPNMTYQRGTALIVALIFLVVITLISITAMRTSTLELRMAANEQEYRIGVDSVESAVLMVVNSNQIRIGVDGEVSCYGFGELPEEGIGGLTCDNTVQMPAGAGIGEANRVTTTIEGSGTCPPSIASSARGASSLRHGGGTSGSCVYFTLQSEYDAVDERGGRVQTQEGFVRLVF